MNRKSRKEDWIPRGAETFSEHVRRSHSVDYADTMSRLMAADLRAQVMFLGEAALLAAQEEKTGLRQKLEEIVQRLADCYVDPIAREESLGRIKQELRDGFPALSRRIGE